MSSLHVLLKITILTWYITIVLSSDDLRRTSMWIIIPQEDSSQYLVPNSFFEIDDNPGLYYATCKNTSPDMHTCTVVRETPLNSQASVKAIDSCKDIGVNVSDLDEYNREIRALFPMTGGNVALMHTSHGESVRFTLVNVMHCDKSSPIIKRLPSADMPYIRPMNMPLVVYEHSFELMMQNDRDCATSQSTTCLVKYNYAGEKLGVRPLQLPNSSDFSSVQVDDENKGSYSLSVPQDYSEDMPFNISYVALDGEVHLIAEDIFSFTDFKCYTSYAHGLFSICWEVLVPDTSLRCLQVDKEKVLVNVTFSAKSLDRAQWFAVHNIQGGGILLASGNNTISPSFQLRQLTKDAGDADSWLKVEAHVEPFECSPTVSGLLIRVMEDKENEEVCFHFVCDNKWISFPRRNGGWKIQYERICVPERLVNGFLTKKL